MKDDLSRKLSNSFIDLKKLEENEMYDYLLNHNYISLKKANDNQKELSVERASCIAYKYQKLLEEMCNFNKKEFLDKIKEIKISVHDSEFFLEYNKIIYDILDKNEKYKETINKAIKYCQQEINVSSLQYERNHNQQDLVYKVAHERILNILKEVE